MNAPTRTQPPAPHRSECVECSGSGITTGYSCCGGQGCGCERDCIECDGEGSLEGYCYRGREVVSIDRAEELHAEADEPAACLVEECPWCAAAEQARRDEDGPSDAQMDGESFCGGEAAALERESMTAAQRLK